MIFKLNESIPNISDKAIDEWNRASYDRRYQMTDPTRKRGGQQYP